MNVVNVELSIDNKDIDQTSRDSTLTADKKTEASVRFSIRQARTVHVRGMKACPKSVHMT